jgi:hypothetical protein
MARTGMRKPMGRRTTEPGSKRYIDGQRPGRIAQTGWTGPTREQTCGESACWCRHTDHATACDPLGCSPF